MAANEPEYVESRGVFTAITLHHPATEHVDDLLRFMRQVMSALKGSAGLIDAHVARAMDGSCLAGVTVWKAPSDFERALPTILGFAPERHPAWTVEPDTAIRLQAM